MPKNRFFVWTADHSGLPLALRLQDEGHKSTMALIKPQYRNGRLEAPKNPQERKQNADKIEYLNKNGTGLINKVWADEAMRRIHSGDLCIFDQIYGWQYGDALWKRGIKVMGGSKIGFTLETERQKTLKMFESLGYDIPEQKFFGPGSSQAAVKFLKGAKDMLFVLKSDNPKVVTQVARDSNDELIQKLNAERRQIDGDGFMLQEKKEGIEFAVQSLYCNGKPILSNIDIEAKGKYNDMSEVQTGCSFGITFPISSDHSLRKRVLGPLDTFVAKYIGTGFMDLSVIYDPAEDKMYPLEPCGSRPAYNDFYAMMAQCRWPLGELFTKLLNGEIKNDLSESVFGSPGFGVSLRVFNDSNTMDQPITYPGGIKK